MRSTLFALIALFATGLARADGLSGLPIGGYEWTGWTSLAGIAVSAPECVTPGEGRIDCFVRGQDGQLWRRAFEGGTWLPWSKAAGLANAGYYAARPECVTPQAGQVDCFVRRHGDGTLFRRTWLGSYMHSWETLGGTLASDPECIVRTPRIDCFARGQDGAMWQNAFDGDAWGGWVSRGGMLAEGTKPACAERDAMVECVVTWAEGKHPYHFDDGSWEEIDDTQLSLPTSENLTPSLKCYGAGARVHCFAPIMSREDGARTLRHFTYDGDWSVEDLGELAPGDLAHYDFDCVVRTKGKFDCMDLSVTRTGSSASARKVSFRHYAFVPGAPAQWRDIPLTMPIDAGKVTFLRCLSVDGKRIDCFTGGNWRGNSTLNQASLIYQERLVFKPMNPVR